MNHDIIRFSHVTVRYASQRRPALEDVCLRIPCNSLTAIVGPNGAGKSTLLRSILGWHPLASGEIRVGDSHAHHALPRLAYLPQRLEIDWDFPITVREVVTQGCLATRSWWRRFADKGRERVESALHEMGLEAVAHRQIAALSGGQQQRMFLARSLAQGADIFLLDEPFASLDLEAAAELAQRLHTWQEQGRTVLAVLHDIELARHAFSRAILLRTRVVAEGPVAEALSPEALAQAFPRAPIPAL